MVDVYDIDGNILDHYSHGGIEVIALSGNMRDYAKYTEPDLTNNMLKAIRSAIETGKPQIEFYRIRSPQTGLWYFRRAYIISNGDGKTVTARIKNTKEHARLITDSNGVVKRAWAYSGFKTSVPVPNLIGTRPIDFPNIEPQGLLAEAKRVFRAGETFRGTVHVQLKDKTYRRHLEIIPHKITHDALVRITDPDLL